MCISSLMLGLSGTIPGLPWDGKVQYMGHGNTEIVSNSQIIEYMTSLAKRSLSHWNHIYSSHIEDMQISHKKRFGDITVDTMRNPILIGCVSVVL